MRVFHLIEKRGVSVFGVEVAVVEEEVLVALIGLDVLQPALHLEHTTHNTHNIHTIGENKQTRIPNCDR